MRAKPTDGTTKTKQDDDSGDAGEDDDTSSTGSVTNTHDPHTPTNYEDRDFRGVTGVISTESFRDYLTTYYPGDAEDRIQLMGRFNRLAHQVGSPFLLDARELPHILPVCAAAVFRQKTRCLPFPSPLSPSALPSRHLGAAPIYRSALPPHPPPTHPPACRRSRHISPYLPTSPPISPRLQMVEAEIVSREYKRIGNDNTRNPWCVLTTPHCRPHRRPRRRRPHAAALAAASPHTFRHRLPH